MPLPNPFTKTVDDIVASFAKTVEQLDSHASKMDSEVTRHAQVIADAEVEKKHAEGEAARARSIREKIAALLEA